MSREGPEGASDAGAEARRRPEAGAAGRRSIEILPDHVANQIAAGEVVERPASVVKELLENALDAGAERIEVAVRGGGKSEIRVSDDGIGMERSDALLALDRHATSKIRVEEDLRSIASYGFRGEALPAIAAVSRLELHTAAREGEGTRVRVEAGRVRGVDEVPRRRGTTVVVRALFHAVPARAKFLGSAAAETRAASEALVLLALGAPRVSFRFESNGRSLLDLPPADDPAERIEAIWGDLAHTLLPVDRRFESGRIVGLVQRPDAARPRGGRRHFFLGARPFRDRALTRLVDEAYRTTVAEAVRPSFFLYLHVDPARVDVNVHPAKTEVRFRDRPAVEAAVRETVRRALSGLESTRPVGKGGKHVADAGPGADAEPARSGAVDGTADVDRPMPQLALFVPGRAAGEAAAEGAEAEALERLAARRPELWQLHDRYILASTRDGLLIVDQHSAHERVLFEEIMARFAGEREGAAQRLLFPITLRLSPAEAGAVEELLGLLRRIGFEIEPFGERTFIVQASPQPHARFDAERCLRDMIHELTEGSPLVDSARNQHERIAKSMACKGAIKAGEPLSPEEMSELFDRLFATELPGHDVHGRPTIVRLTLDELDRRFGRSS